MVERNSDDRLRRIALDVLNRMNAGTIDKAGINASQPDGLIIKAWILKLDPSIKVHRFGGSAKEQERFWDFFRETRPKFRDNAQRKEVVIAPEGLLVGRSSAIFPMDPSNPYRVGMYGIVGMHGISEYSSVEQLVAIVPFPPSDGITLKLCDQKIVELHDGRKSSLHLEYFEHNVRKLSPYLEYIGSLDANGLAKLMLDSDEVMCLREVAAERLHQIVSKQKGLAPSKHFNDSPELWQNWWEENRKFATSSV